MADFKEILVDGQVYKVKDETARENAGSGGYEPPQGGIPKTDLAQSVQDTLDDVSNKVDKVNGKGLSTNDYTDADEALVATIPSKANDAEVVKSISVNGTAQTKDGNGNVNISTPTKTSDLTNDSGFVTEAVQSVSVDTNGDGTVDINVDDDTYTINLNHTHENMAKLIVCEESDLPSTLEEDTIYGVEEDGEISVLYVGGIPFYGYGGGVSGPVLRRPADGSTIDMGETVNGSVSKTINVKGKNLTQALTIELDGTGYAFGNTQPSGVTIVSTTELTVTAEAANALNGVDIVVVYTGSAAIAECSLGITSSSPDNISCEATLVATSTVFENLAGVKFTGSQWLQTDYKPNRNTEFRLNCRFEQNSNTQSTSQDAYEGNIFSVTAGQSNKWFYLRNPASTAAAPYNPWNIQFVNEESVNYGNDVQIIGIGGNETTRPYFLVNPVEIYYTKGSTAGLIGFTDGTHTLTKNTSLKSSTQENAMMIGRTYNAGNGKDKIYNMWDLTIYSFIITENGNEVRHWVPKTRNGIPGLYDTVNGTFISSETSTELVAVPLT